MKMVTENQEYDYCDMCCELFPVDEEGEIDCNCAVDPYAENPHKTLDFND